MIFRETFGLPGRPGDVDAIGVLAPPTRSGGAAGPVCANVDRSAPRTRPAGSASSVGFMAAVGRHALAVPRCGRRSRRATSLLGALTTGPGGMLGQVRDVILLRGGAAAPEPPSADASRSCKDAWSRRCPPPPGPRRCAGRRSPWRGDRRGGGGRVRPVGRRRSAAPGGRLAILHADVSHDQAMDRLAVSRATYYRYLRQAPPRLAAALVTGRCCCKSSPTPRQVDCLSGGR